MKDWNKLYTTDEQMRLGRRLAAKQRNAEERGMECTLNMEDMFLLGFKLLGHGTCDYTNLGLSTLIAGSQPDHAKYPTIERIDDTKGYVRGNVCVVMQRANQLKDNLIDKRTATTIIDPIDREIVKAMMLNMSRDHLESLKTKYLPEVEKEEPKMELEMQNDGSLQTPVANSFIAQEHEPLGPIATLEEAVAPAAELPPAVVPSEPEAQEEVEEEEAAQTVPDDVAIAKAYAKYCTDFAAVGMNVSVSFAQFKSKYTRKVCALTGEELNDDPKFILVLDLKIGFAKDNFIVVGNKIGKAITTMMISTGFSVPRIWGMLNKVVG
ncbi:putative anti-sigma factor [Erwinia phage Hena1]|uniref:Putative anti-sigma factor n=1 Tax=Erwinia phage Hena1 TaxID=2678601 RepID=A0A6B9J5R8_9CAUD|nr:HNH endonuclease [Erwinia phage Hena1]QGZ16380.1 putative anti-sigma factor [Erwinia phage Hena1]